MSADYVIAIDLVVDGAALPRFMPLLEANVRASLATEPGCRRFDICVDQADPARILLCEIYDDAAAFDAHLQTEHFRQFDSDTKAMVVSKALRRLTLRPA